MVRPTCTTMLHVITCCTKPRSRWSCRVRHDSFPCLSSMFIVLPAVGGQDKIRPLWKHYYDNTDALIWIVDSADPSRVEEARDELHKVLADDCLRGASVLV